MSDDAAIILFLGMCMSCACFAFGLIKIASALRDLRNGNLNVNWNPTVRVEHLNAPLPEPETKP